ncbi:unnamed protein product, partial [Polarella glacialis]
ALGSPGSAGPWQSWKFGSEQWSLVHLLAGVKGTSERIRRLLQTISNDREMAEVVNQVDAVGKTPLHHVLRRLGCVLVDGSSEPQFNGCYVRENNHAFSLSGSPRVAVRIFLTSRKQWRFSNSESYWPYHTKDCYEGLHPPPQTGEFQNWEQCESPNLLPASITVEGFRSDFSEIVSRLLQSKADLTKMDTHRRTPLHQALTIEMREEDARQFAAATMQLAGADNEAADPNTLHKLLADMPDHLGHTALQASLRNSCWFSIWRSWMPVLMRFPFLLLEDCFMAPINPRDKARPKTLLRLAATTLEGQSIDDLPALALPRKGHCSSMLQVLRKQHSGMLQQLSLQASGLVHLGCLRLVREPLHDTLPVAKLSAGQFEVSIWWLDVVELPAPIALATHHDCLQDEPAAAIVVASNSSEAEEYVDVLVGLESLEVEDSLFRQLQLNGCKGAAAESASELMPLRPQHWAPDEWRTVGVHSLMKNSGKFYHEVKVGSGDDPQIGWVTEHFTFCRKGGSGVGDDEEGWGVDGRRRGLWYQGQMNGAIDVRWKSGDILGLAVDIEGKKLKFAVNGKWTHEYEFEPNGRKIYPALSVRGDVKMLIPPSQWQHSAPVDYRPWSEEGCFDE